MLKSLNQYKLKVKVKIKLYEYTLNDVLYVPELSKNLLLVNAPTENNDEITFFKNKVIKKG